MTLSLPPPQNVLPLFDPVENNIHDNFEWMKGDLGEGYMDCFVLQRSFEGNVSTILTPIVDIGSDH